DGPPIAFPSNMVVSHPSRRSRLRRKVYARPAETVGELMRSPPLTVRPEDDLRLARQMMLWAGCHHLPVLRGQDLVGMLSDRAIADRQLAAPDDPGTVESVMQRYPQTAHPGDRVGDAALRMSERGLDALPVTDEGRL